MGKKIVKGSGKYLAMTALALTPYLAKAQTSFDYQDKIPGFNVFQQTNIAISYIVHRTNIFL